MARICIVTSTFPLNPNDSARAPFALEMIRGLTARNHQVTVLTQDLGGASVDGWPEFRVKRFAWRESEGRVVDLFPLRLRNLIPLISLLVNGIRALRKAHQQERFDLVVCFWAVPAGFYAWCNSLLGGFPPYCIWALGSDILSLKKSRLGRQVLKLVLRGAVARYADGLGLAEEVRGISNTQCGFMPTFRTLNSVSRGDTPDPSSARLGEKAKLRFLFVGRHEHVKGPDCLIEALRKLRSSAPDSRFSLDLVGEGQLTPLLKERVLSGGLEKDVHFHGKVDDQQLASLYSLADCVVIPSRSESVPLVFGEALQFSKPLVVTDVGDMGMLVKKYRLGLVCARPEPETIADALLAFIKDPVRPAQTDMREARDFLSFERNLGNWIQELESVAERNVAT